MPATYTHHIFTEDVYKVINDNIQYKLRNSKDMFNLFGKSFDILYFTNKSSLGHFAHNNNVNLYFQNIITYIREHDLINNGDVLAYLYGSICHYVLDSTVHPYIYYKTGKYKPKNKKTYKYKGMHAYYEYMIDAAFYETRNLKPIYRRALSKELFPKIVFEPELKKIIDYTYLNTFCVSNMSKYIIKGKRNYAFVMKHIMESRLGIKSFFYKIIDKTKLVKRWTLNNNCYYIKKIDKRVINLEHKKWFYPVDKKMNYHYSVYDLYDLAIEKARVLINLINESLTEDDKTIKKVLKEIGDLSYTTGKKWAQKYKHMEYEY